LAKVRLRVDARPHEVVAGIGDGEKRFCRVPPQRMAEIGCMGPMARRTRDLIEGGRSREIGPLGARVLAEEGISRPYTL